MKKIVKKCQFLKKNAVNTSLKQPIVSNVVKKFSLGKKR